MYETRISCLDLKSVADSGQCFRWKTEGCKVGIIAFGRYVEISQRGDVFSFDCTRQEYEDIWRNYLDIDTDYELVCGRADGLNDSLLRAAVNAGRGIRILNQDFFEVLISFIISQNNNIPRIKKITEAFCERFGKPVYASKKMAGFSFPAPEDLRNLKPQDLKGLGLGYRDKYLCDAVRWYLSGGEDMVLELRNMPAGEQRRILKQSICGVGDKVANCVMLFGLHKLDACPIDVWMKKLIKEDYGGVCPAWMTDKYAGIYQQYTFYYKRGAR